MQATPYDGLCKVKSTRDNFDKSIHKFQPET